MAAKILKQICASHVHYLLKNNKSDAESFLIVNTILKFSQILFQKKFAISEKQDKTVAQMRISNFSES